MVMSESIRLVAIGIVPGLAAVPRADQFVQTVVYRPVACRFPDLCRRGAPRM